MYRMAWRNIWRNKLRSIVIMFSISIGLFAGIAVLALYKGMMKARVRTTIDAEVGHLQIHARHFTGEHEPAFTLYDGQQLMHAIASLPGIKLVAPRSITNGMLATTTGSAGVQINGIQPEPEYAASQLNKKIVEGSLFDTTRKHQVMIGRKLAKKMKLECGSKLVLTFTDTSGSIVSGAFRVAAIYQSANAPLDERNVYITMKEMNALLAIGPSFHELVILLHNDEDLENIYRQLKNRYPSYVVESWKEISPETDLMVKTTNQLSYILIVIIMFSLAFGIINTMLMAVLERTREIGMMVALGTTKLKIFLLILLETVYLTLAGVPLGVLLAWLPCQHFNKQGLDLSGMGREMMSSFGYNTLVYPEFPNDKLWGVMLIVFSTAIISCLFPALKALQLQPVEALKR